MLGEIALEEHFSLTQDDFPQYVNLEAMTEIKTRVLDLAAIRLREMDAAGISYSLLSLTAPGIQAEPDPQRAATRARQANDTFAEVVAGTPARYGGFATLPTQDPQAAQDGPHRFPGWRVAGREDASIQARQVDWTRS